MIVTPDSFATRKAETEARLKEFQDRIGGSGILKGFGNLSIYIAGSFGRDEASRYSDLDLFFINIGKDEPPNRISSLSQLRGFAEIILIAEAMGFEDFSNDGEFLKIHYLDHIKEELGGPQDDFRNHFTARMLLLLESKFVFNNNAYLHTIKDCIGCYYRDYPDHSSDFRATFLANDIMRFWKTFCLNYEHRRNRPADDADKRIANHLKNLKLKYSRLWTCFSMILCLAKHRNQVDPEHVLRFVQMTPLERLQDVATGNEQHERLASQIIEAYDWFLVQTARPKADTLKWIASPVDRADAFQRAKVFGDKIFDLLRKVANDETMRYLTM